MTDLLNPPTDLTAYESDFSPVLLGADAQHLLFTGARTANAFTDDPVSDATIARIYDLMKWAPTAMNSQPLRVVLVRSTAARERLAAHMSGNNAQKTRSAPLVAILAADLDFHEEFDKTAPGRPGLKDNFADQAVRERMARFSATLQAGYFILAVRAAGLAAGPMTGFDHEGVDADFFPSGDHRTLLVANLGYPAADAYRPRQPRLDAAEVVTVV